MEIKYAYIKDGKMRLGRVDIDDNYIRDQIRIKDAINDVENIRLFK